MWVVSLAVLLESVEAYEATLPCWQEECHVAKTVVWVTAIGRAAEQMVSGLPSMQRRRYQIAAVARVS